MTDYKPAWQATWEGFAEVLAADREQRQRAERMARARVELRDPPKARSNAERRKAAQGLHTHGQTLQTSRQERARIAEHRSSGNV